jgi:ketosteroid isomerase-like protein
MTLCVKAQVAGLALALLSLWVLPASAKSDRAADRQEITAGETAWGAAFVTGDVATVQRLLTPDFMGVTDSGRAYDKASILKEVAKVTPGGADQTGPLTIVFHGDTAIVQGRERETDPPPSRKVTPIIFTDTWMRIGGSWRIVAAQDTVAASR